MEPSSRDLKEVRGWATSLTTYGEGSSALENLLGEAGRAGSSQAPESLADHGKGLRLSAKLPESCTRTVRTQRQKQSG